MNYNIFDEINKIVDDEEKTYKILKKFDVHKRPERRCFQCLHYKKILPGQITYVGGHFPNIEECSYGHKISRYAADYCKDFFEV